MTDKYLEHFVYLDELRESGVTNMFGAGEYLEAEFGMDRKEARIVLQLWMNQFSSAKDPTIYTQRAAF